STTVTVISGGDSSERIVSLSSGRQVYEAFREGGRPAVLMEIDDINDLASRLDEIEVAFIALHGGDGEDGTVQQLLQDHGIPYAGSGPSASAIGMDKLATKKVLIEAGITVPHAMNYSGEDMAQFADKVMKEFSLPVVVKAQGQGESIGVKLVKDVRDLVPTFEDLHNEFGPFFVDEFISGREFTVPVLRMDGEDTVLPIIEVKSKTDFFSFEAKYTGDNFEVIIPAPLDEPTAQHVRDVTLRTHQAIGCWGFSRVDVLLSASGDPYVIEINTLPGMSHSSVMHRSAQVAGIDLPHLVELMLQSAFDRPQSG
ncbi:MAG TPA: D-alanine--D-alanine ligase, partial [Candidatus Acetothermia bacterium]|nr:D-alanine--D-alanine ligase [Candidatus Acetothermia bacterium]HEX32356.1 D-alanine--D-alanine ligase [Candidatus Acetothermia bacterium]